MAADLKQCEQMMGGQVALTAARTKFYEEMAKAGWFDLLASDEKGGITRSYHVSRWYFFVEPLLSSLASFTDKKVLEVVKNRVDTMSYAKPFLGEKRKTFVEAHKRKYPDDANGLEELVDLSQ